MVVLGAFLASTPKYVTTPKASSNPKVSLVSPKNLVNDGVMVGKQLTVALTPAYKNTETFKASKFKAEAGAVPQVDIFVDYQCPFCGAFEQAQKEQLKAWTTDGRATVSYHIISFLDQASPNQYSSRAANSAACVADADPNKFFAYNQILFDTQPAEKKAGPSNAELIKKAVAAGVTATPSFTACITDGKFSDWVLTATARTAGPIPNSSIARVEATPTVLVNGVAYTASPTDAAGFQKFVLG